MLSLGTSPSPIDGLAYLPSSQFLDLSSDVLFLPNTSTRLFHGYALEFDPNFKLFTLCSPSLLFQLDYCNSPTPFLWAHRVHQSINFTIFQCSLPAPLRIPMSLSLLDSVAYCYNHFFAYTLNLVGSWVVSPKNARLLRGLDWDCIWK